MGDIDDLLRNSDKAELIEAVTEAVEDSETRIAVVFLQHKLGGKYTVQSLFWRVNSTVEAAGMFEIARHDLLHDDEVVTSEP